MVERAQAPDNVQVKYQRLQDLLSEMGSVLVAFSAGVDSTFLAKVAYDVLGDRAVTATAASETYPSEEFEESKQLAESIGIRQIIIETRELDNEQFAANPPNRCYFCKGELFGKLKELAAENGLSWVADGFNHDDLNDIRPGMQAGRELGVRSPLREAGLTKSDIRDLSRQLGLSTWSKPALACLSSRIPYGSPITLEKLDKVGRAERFLRELGFKGFRVRHHDDLARIEVLPEDFVEVAARRREITEYLKGLGYVYVTLDLQGYRTGSMNEVLRQEAQG